MSSPSPLATGMEALNRDRAVLDRLIDEGGLTADFQPIVRVADGGIAAYKASARGPVGTTLAGPAGLLSASLATGHLERLDWMFRCAAFELAADAGLGRSAAVHLVLEPETYGSPCPPRLAGAFGRAKRELDVVVEVPLRAFDDIPGLRAGLSEIRTWGWRVAFDDCADKPEAVHLLAELAPDFIKLDLAQPGRVDGAGQHAGVSVLLAHAANARIPLVAESVDTEGRRESALALGAALVRGNLVGRPTKLPSA